MTDEFIGENVSPENNAVNDVSDNYSPAPTQSEPSEKMVPQSKVNDLIGHAKAQTSEKVRRELEAQYSQKQSQSDSNVKENTNAQGFNNDIERQVSEVFERKQREYQADMDRRQTEELGRSIIEKFSDSLEKSKDEFPDLMSKLRLESMPTLVPLGVSVENTAQVMDEFARNPLKAFQYHQMYLNDPAGAIEAVKIMADSIKANSEASKQRFPRDPLSQTHHSTTKPDDGDHSVAYYKNLDYLKGY